MSETLSPEDAIYVMRRNCPLHDGSTFGPCGRGCGRSARGCGVCFECARSDLAGHVGNGLANEMAHAVKCYAQAYRLVMEARENHHERKATDGGPTDI